MDEDRPLLPAPASARPGTPESKTEAGTVTIRSGRRRAIMTAALCLAATVSIVAQTVQTSTVSGSVHDQSGGALPGVAVELRQPGAQPLVAYTDTTGSFSLDVAPGHYQATFT